ncbi:MAG: phospho-N-acetylmuramoyl-pentapeptide-transferase [Clostridiales bacterium]|nr:phospho-N-acetylmuramoyl-pentapeptide-transferase [Clostridiales bacterium]
MDRIIYSVIISFIFTLALGVAIIPMLRKLKLGQNIRDDGPKSHFSKAGTPTMGGIMFIIPIILVSLALSTRSYDYVIAAVLSTLAFGAIGFIDDFINVYKKRSLGLRAYQKLLGQIIISVLFAFFVYRNSGSTVYVPFTDIQWDLGYFYIPIIVFIMVGTVNSVNLTDGLDGLASGVTLIVASTMSIIAAFATYAMQEEGLIYIAENYKNLSIFAAAMAGGCLGFLRFNTNPAKVFMGDTGSMALGGGLVAIMVLLKMPLLLPIIGGVYMAESLSVIIQVISFKSRGKRIFRMSPLHHHYELGGMPETRVVAMFMIATVLLCLIGLLAV